MYTASATHLATFGIVSCFSFAGLLIQCGAYAIGMTNHKQLIESVLKGVNGTNIRKVGEKLLKQEKASVVGHPGVLALAYDSYDPSLTYADFAKLVTQRQMSMTSTPQTIKFDLLKRRDPKYFTFKDQYLLLFNRNIDLRDYLNITKDSTINRVRVRWRPLVEGKDEHSSYLGERHELIYRKYCRNLEAAYLDRKQYFDVVNKEMTQETISDEPQLSSLIERIHEIEKKCAVVWNMPMERKQLEPYFSFYDIVHSFDMYWNRDLSKTFKFIRFNTQEDCKQFKKNYHGYVYDETNPDVNKILVETLNGM